MTNSGWSTVSLEEKTEITSELLQGLFRWPNFIFHNQFVKGTTAWNDSVCV